MSSFSSTGRTDSKSLRSDIKRARALLQSLIKTNPKHAPGWVAAAWLENVAGKSVQARKIIAEGCNHCSKNEDVWIAASELNVSSLRLGIVGGDRTKSDEVDYIADERER